MSQLESTASSTSTLVPATGNRRRKILTWLLLVFGSIGLAGFLWWFLIDRWWENTDNAYVLGNIVQVTPQTSGQVVRVNVNNTDRVRKGQLLVQMDETDAKVALQSTIATLADAVRNVRGLYASTSQSDAGIEQARADLSRARHQADLVAAQQQNAHDEYNRIINLRKQKFVSVESLNQAQTALQVAEASLAAANSAVNAFQAALQKAQAQQAGAAGQTENTSITNHPKVQAAAVQVRQAYLILERTRILAPASGDVAQCSVQVGMHVTPGMALMAIIPPEQMWVEANFKETQLTNMRIGQPVRLSADLYGSDLIYQGEIAGFSAGTGSAFSLLPAQNASGNWIKIIQRVPVRIKLNPDEVRKHLLRIGLSMSVQVDTRDRSGSIVTIGSGEDKATFNDTDVFAQQGKKVDALIEQIIADNSEKVAR